MPSPLSASWSYDAVRQLSGLPLLLRSKAMAGLELKGQFIETEMGGEAVLLFMGSVRPASLEDMTVSGRGGTAVGQW